MIGVIDPGVRSLELDCFNSIVSLSNKPALYLCPAICGLEGREAFLDRVAEGSISHVIILGSASSVHDGLEWQPQLETVVRAVIDRKIPILGICYGHQMLAHLFGGEVGYVRADKQKELGSREILMTSARLDYRRTQIRLVVTHNEMVTKLPSEFQVSGVSKTIAIDAMEHRSLPIFSVQAHPEATPSFVASRQMMLTDSENTFRDGADFVSRFLRI